MEYIPHYFVRIRHILKGYNILLFAKSLRKVEYLVHRMIDPIDKYDNFKVYVISFNVNSRLKTYKYEGMATWKLLVSI